MKYTYESNNVNWLPYITLNNFVIVIIITITYSRHSCQRFHQGSEEQISKHER